MESGQADRQGRRIKVMLVDDHEVVRRGLRSLVETTDDLEVVGEAGSVAEAIRRAEQSQPDVVVMDVRLPDGSGIEAARDIRARRPATRVLMLTSYADEIAVFGTLADGDQPYLVHGEQRHFLAFEVDEVSGRDVEQLLEVPLG